MHPHLRPSSAPATSYKRSASVTLRWATPADAESVENLSQLDEAPVPAAPLLLAFVGDELWVAASLSTGALISDPFRPSAEVAALALERGRQLTVSDGAHGRRFLSLLGRHTGRGVHASRVPLISHET